MAELSEAWQAGIDAVIADNPLNRGGFVDALQTVATSGLSNAEGNDFVDAVAAEFNRLGIINNPTYNNLRNNIISDAVVHAALFNSIGTIGTLPETQPVISALQLTGLREDRDNADAAIARLDDLIAAEPGPAPIRRLVREVLRVGKQQIRDYKQNVRDQIQNILGDPDA